MVMLVPNMDEGNEKEKIDEYNNNLLLARTCIPVSLLWHFGKLSTNIRNKQIITKGNASQLVVLSASFVHREQAIWRRKPCHNPIWFFTSTCLLIAHTFIAVIYIYWYNENLAKLIASWHILTTMLLGPVLSLIISEICKWQEIKYVYFIS